MELGGKGGGGGIKFLSINHQKKSIFFYKKDAHRC